MNKKWIILLISLLCFTLFACSNTGSPEPALPADSAVNGQLEEVSEPSETDPAQPGSVYVTGIDEIVGTWVASADLGIFVAVISPDGMFRVATSSDDLEKGSTDSWQLSFEGDQILATDYALCLGDVGNYLAEINPDGTLKFTTISDPCSGRLRKMDRSLPGRLTPYNLLFHPVD